MRSTLFFICFLTLTIIACHDSGRGAGTMDVDALYLDYSITATENGNAVCMLRFRAGGRNGMAVLLDQAYKVELDGQQLKPDSANFAGIYYEAVEPVQGFAGKHRIGLAVGDNKKITEEFDFTPFELENELPAEITNQPFVIKIKNLPRDQMLMHLVMIDTSFLSNDVNETVVVDNGEVRVNQTMLRQLRPGPVSLELTLEQSMPLHQKTKAGGRFWTSYSLKRDFELLN